MTFPTVHDKSPEPIQASKWLTSQVLLDADEMEALFTFLQPSRLFCTSCLCSKEQAIVSTERFLASYANYANELKNGRLPNDADYRHVFACALTRSVEALFALSVESQFLIRVQRPVVQMQPHRLGYSQADQKFRSMTYGPESISWGIQFNYPQLFHDPITCEVHQVKANDFFPNTDLFQTLQRWVRNNTSPVPFIVENKLTNVPIRLGKQCFSWINNHPQLAAKRIRVKERSN